MKLLISKRLLGACIAAHVGFIFTQLYLYTSYISTNYTLQKLQKELKVQQQLKQTSMQELYGLQDMAHIKEYAKKELNMKKIKLSHIKQLDWS